MQPSAHATTLNFDEVSFKEHGVSVLPSSKIISSLCVCTTGFDTARSMFMIASINGIHSQYFHQPSVCQKKTYNPISGATRPKLGFRSPFGKFGLSKK